MAMSDALISELEQEAASTRRVLERLPAEQLTWRPHPRSWTLGQLGLHVAGIPGNVARLAAQSIDGAPAFVQPEPKDKEEILAAFEASIEDGKAALSGWNDADMVDEWSMSVDGDKVMAMPRGAFVRSIMFNHLYHHRGQLLVYLRLLDEPVPAVYGVSADENPFAPD